MTKKALITGASEGIGRSIAILLASEGYMVTGVARNEDKLKDLTSLLGAGHGHIVADLATEIGQDAVVDALRADHYDILVNNAGIGASGTFAGMPVERSLAVMRLNCEALVKLSHAYLQTARPGDALVNVSSVLAYVPTPELGIYSATKSFVTAFSEALWYEQRKNGVFVMALHPGMTATDFQVHAGGDSNHLPKGFSQTPEDVALAAWHGLKERHTPTVISGGRNTLFAGLARLLPAKTVVSLVGRMRSKS